MSKLGSMFKPAKYLCALFFFILAQAKADEPNACRLLDNLTIQVSKHRQLPILTKLKCVLLSKDKFEELKLKGVAQSHKAIEREEYLYKALGLIPKTYNYAFCEKSNLLKEPRPFYSFKKKTVFIPDWIKPSLFVLAHEITHALQDQNFGLENIFKKHVKSTDSFLAVNALLEGDAENTSELYPEVEKEKYLGSINDECITPQAIISLNDFPYGFGQIFVKRRLSSEGFSGLNRVFKDPPTTSRYIMLSNESSRYTCKMPYRKKCSSVYKDTLGQYFYRLILGNFLPKEEAILAAKGWCNDELDICREASGNFFIKARVKFDNNKEASEFFSAFRKIVSARYKVTIDNNARYFAINTDEFFSTQLEDDMVNFEIKPETDECDGKKCAFHP